jgi:hypothetical protein
MKIEDARKMVSDQQSTIENVLKRYVSVHGCPCNWQQFEYWTSKKHGPGWQDSSQNYLIAAAVQLPCFCRKSCMPIGYGDNTSLTCVKCGTEWLHCSEEWRMLAFRERMLRMPWPREEIVKFGELVGPGVFATAGLEPENQRTLSLNEWAEFMLGEQYYTETSTSETEAEAETTKTIPREPQPGNFLRLVWNYFK